MDLIQNKADTSMRDWPDDEIIAHTTDIGAALIALTMHAGKNGDRGSPAVRGFSRPTRLLDDQRAVASTAERAGASFSTASRLGARRWHKIVFGA